MLKWFQHLGGSTAEARPILAVVDRVKKGRPRRVLLGSMIPKIQDIKKG